MKNPRLGFRGRPGLLAALISVTALAATTPACDDDGAAPDTIEIAGSWNNGFGHTESISASQWTADYGDGAVVISQLVEYDNATNVAVTQNAADAEFSPGAFNKVVWVEPAGDVFYYCTVAFGLDTAAMAMSAPDTSDPNALETDGCGSFSWTRMTRI